MRKASEYHPHVREIARILVARYGDTDLGNKKNPFNELLYILLSSKTPPARYQETYASLRRAFPKADQLALASTKSIAQAVQVGGLGLKKAKQIGEIARSLRSRFGRVTLAPLQTWNTSDIERFLKELPGVGIKVARCVELFSFGRNVFPVDAHCLRIGSRLEWCENSLTERVADQMQKGIPPNLRRRLHVGFVLLGREFCKPSGPRCHSCPLVKFCPAGKTNLRRGGCGDSPLYRAD